MITHILNLTLSKFPSATGGLQQSKKVYPRFEFHILASARKKYQVDQSLFTSSGNVIFPNYHAVRLLAQKMNALRDLQKHPEQSIRAGQLNAMGLIDEIYHYVLRLYEETANPKVFERVINKIDQTVKSDKFNETLNQFGILFPPLEVYLGESTLEDYLKSTTGGKPHTEVTLEELILLYFSNINPANTPFKELFNDKDLKERTAYFQLISEAEKLFQTEKRFGPQNQYIFDLLRAPILASPSSLGGQLEYIKKNWGLILSDKFLKRILSAGDLFKEDMRIIFHGEAPTPPVPTYKYHELVDAGLLDLERFTSDFAWMPNVVLLAKNIYVWLDQLSKKYKRPITKLNEIPDEELNRLARWNFTALWLIGIWERSSASQKIKQWTGNPEAVYSEYSV
ncbi:MAG: alpha-amylase, partial [Ignavibacteriales bacterium]|nr:alpha-amylase [Ignavibacteriales bacterium]